MPFDWNKMSEEDRAVMEELRRRVEELGYTMPPPSDTEFYMKLWSLYNEYRYMGLSYADIADKLGVSLSLVKQRMARWNRRMQTDAARAMSAEGGAMELPSYLQALLSRQIAKYFGRNVDTLTRTTITEIVGTGAKIYEEYGSWLKENVSPDLVEAASECIEFYRKHHDKIHQLEAKINLLEQQKKVLLELVKPKLPSLILFEIATHKLVSAIISGADKSRIRPLYSLAMYAARNFMEVPV